MVRAWKILILFALVTTTVSPARAQLQTVLTSQRDNTMYYDTSNAVSNGLGPTMIAGLTAGNFGTMVRPRRALVWFNVAAFVPAGATITGAELLMSTAKLQNGVQTVSLHKMNATAFWGEGASNASALPGQGDIATAGDVTWIHRVYPDTLWTAMGADGDYAVTATQSAAIVGIGTNSWPSNAAMVADVQDWLDNPQDNNGWIIIGNEIDSSQTAKAFYTKDFASPSQRPQLIVDYLPPISVGDDENRPRYFELAQNYPNPFNPSTAIAYSLERPAHVRLTVYDVAGRTIRVLVDAREGAGDHRATWDGTDQTGEEMGSGTYLYSLQIGSEISTRKMVLMR